VEAQSQMITPQAKTSQSGREMPTITRQPFPEWNVQRIPEQSTPPADNHIHQELVETATTKDPVQMQVIQRAESTEQAQVSPLPPAASTTETSSKTASFSDKDLDTLARQVYAEIRQKLSIERERTRRRW
jgi:hypothetical protein